MFIFKFSYFFKIISLILFLFNYINLSNQLTYLNNTLTFNSNFLNILNFLWSSKILYYYYFAFIFISMILGLVIKKYKYVSQLLLYSLLLTLFYSISVYFNSISIYDLNIFSNHSINYLLLNSLNNIHPPLLYFSAAYIFFISIFKEYWVLFKITFYYLLFISLSIFLGS